MKPCVKKPKTHCLAGAGRVGRSPGADPPRTYRHVRRLSPLSGGNFKRDQTTGGSRSKSRGSDIRKFPPKGRRQIEDGKTGFASGKSWRLAIHGAGLNWRIALPVAAALVVIGLALGILAATTEDGLRRPRPASIQFASVPDADSDWRRPSPITSGLPISLWTGLDAFLTRQGNQTLPAMPIYTASTRPG